MVFTGPGLAEMSDAKRNDPTPSLIDSAMSGKLGCQHLKIGCKYRAMRASLSTRKAQTTEPGDSRNFEKGREHKALHTPHTFGRRISTLRSHKSSLLLNEDSESNSRNVCEAENHVS